MIINPNDFPSIKIEDVLEIFHPNDKQRFVNTLYHISLYSASQKKRNRELSMFYHNLIAIIINK